VKLKGKVMVKSNVKLTPASSFVDAAFAASDDAAATAAAATAAADAADSYAAFAASDACLLYTSPSPRDGLLSRMPSSA